MRLIHIKKQTWMCSQNVCFSPWNFPNQSQLCNNQFMKTACVLSSKTCKAFFSSPGHQSQFIRVYLSGIYFLSLHCIRYRFKFPAVDKYADTKQDVSSFIYFCMLITFLCLQINTDESSYYKVKIARWHQVFLFLWSHFSLSHYGFFFCYYCMQKQHGSAQ